MIERYQIKTVDNREVLYLYLNYSYEFGDFFKEESITNLKERVKNYIARMKIKFEGSKVLFVLGGIGLATIFLTPTDISDIQTLQANYTSSSVIQKIVDVDSSFNDGLISVDEGIKKEEEIEIENVENNEFNSVLNTQTEVQNDKNINTKISSVNSNVVVDTNVTEEHSQVQETVSDAQEDVSSLQNLVTVYRSNGTILQISFEDYIVGVVAAEMPASFPVEALKAQAVVARTYANQRLSKGLTLTDSVSTQVFKDESELRAMWGSSYNTYYSKIKGAVEATNGLSIYYNGNYIDAVYHSTSNGYTEDAAYVWGNDVAYLKSVASPWDTTASSYFRVEEKSEQVLLSTLGFSITNDTVVEIISRDASGRVLEVRIGDSIYDGVTLRNILGLRSADFDLEVKDGSLVVTTRGYGHGVGMSQYGASGMAQEGYSFIDILKHYYTGISIY